MSFVCTHSLRMLYEHECIFIVNSYVCINMRWSALRMSRNDEQREGYLYRNDGPFPAHWLIKSPKMTLTPPAPPPKKNVDDQSQNQPNPGSHFGGGLNWVKQPKWTNSFVYFRRKQGSSIFKQNEGPVNLDQQTKGPVQGEPCSKGWPKRQVQAIERYCKHG